jgi:hypothetical protein
MVCRVYGMRAWLEAVDFGFVRPPQAPIFLANQSSPVTSCAPGRQGLGRGSAKELNMRHLASVLLSISFLLLIRLTAHA